MEYNIRNIFIKIKEGEVSTNTTRASANSTSSSRSLLDFGK